MKGNRSRSCLSHIVCSRSLSCVSRALIREPHDHIVRLFCSSSWGPMIMHMPLVSACLLGCFLWPRVIGTIFTYILELGEREWFTIICGRMEAKRKMMLNRIFRLYTSYFFKSSVSWPWLLIRITRQPSGLQMPRLHSTWIMLESLWDHSWEPLLLGD